MPQTPALLSLSDIAALARVQRPVVSTWRRRYPDFPRPVAAEGNRAWFDGREVTAWLTATGLGNTPDDDLRAELALHGLIHHAGEIGAERLVSLLGSLLCLRQLDDKPLAETTADSLLDRAERMDFDDEFVLRELRDAPETAARIAPLAEELVEAAYTPAGAHEQLMASRHRLGLAGPSTAPLATEVRRLIVHVADPAQRALDRGDLTVADPHACCGDLLNDIVTAVDAPSAVGVLAAERREGLARLVRRRLLLTGVEELDLDVRIGVELEERITDPDLVVTALPYRAGETRSSLEVLEEVEAIGDLLGPGRTAVIVGPADALVDELTSPATVEVRSRLLGSGLVESVVRLPGGADPYRPGYDCALWTLTREPVDKARGYVLLCDVSGEELDGDVRARLAEDILLWRAEGASSGGHAARYGRAVPVKELQERFGAPLVPPGPSEARRLSRTADDRPALIAEAETRLSEAAERCRTHTATHGSFRSGLMRRVADAPARTTVGALVSQRRLAQVRGHRISPEHLDRRGGIAVLGPEEILGRAPRGSRRVDRVLLAAEYPHASLTEPGDVVYTTSPEFGTVVDDEGGSVVAFPARALRPVPDARRPLTPRVLALLLATAPGGGRSPSAVRAARSVEDTPLPELPPAEVRRLDALLAEIERRRALLDAQYAELDEILGLAGAGLSDGTLTVPGT
ncbi:serine/threonine-protein kinase [Salinactinospora qingdaonensis]|uniref:N-6 DNA methylase n=1 Tax=Salinactinospora qingdaonensis TaxID=702744 RepID=A0ABP7GBL0_9ACTN